MEFKKKTLINIINEVNSMDVDEMARPQKGTQAGRTNPETGEEKPFLIKSGFLDTNPDKNSKSGIPDYWIVNPTKTIGDEVLIIPADCEDIMEFKEKNKEWIESVGLEKKLEPQVVVCRKQAKPTGDVYKPTDKWPILGQIFGIKPENKNRLEARTRLLKYHLNPIIKDEFTKNFDKELQKRSFAPILADTKFTDVYSEINNEKIRFNAHSYINFEKVNDFTQSIINNAKSKGGLLELEPRNPEDAQRLARQYNLQYANWLESKKSDKRYFGKTQKYLLDAFGYEEKNINATVRTDLSLKGDLDMENKTYTWEVKVTVKFGKKLEDEPRIKGGLQEEKVLSSTKQVNFELDEPYTKFSNEYTVLDNPSIKSGLIEVIYDIKNQITQLPVTWMLNTATRSRLQLSESTTDNTVNRILKEIKKRK